MIFKKKKVVPRTKISRKIIPETEPSSSIRRRKLVKGETHGFASKKGLRGGEGSLTCRDDYKFKLKLIIVFVLIRTAACGFVHLRLEALPPPLRVATKPPSPRKPTAPPPPFATTPVNFAPGISTLINRYLSARFFQEHLFLPVPKHFPPAER